MKGVHILNFEMRSEHVMNHAESVNDNLKETSFSIDILFETLCDKVSGTFNKLFSSLFGIEFRIIF